MSDDEDETTCPLCVEEMDLSDKNFLPCPCGYRVCMWCWHHIRENLNGLCPACRTPYNADPHAFSAVDRQEIVKKNRERKQKEKQERKVTDKPVARPVIVTVADRRHLHNYRVVQRNLVYVIGLPSALNTEDTLRRPEYFGQYGKISKVVVHRTQTPAAASVSVYVTFTFKEDAKAAIQALDGFWIEGCILRASFGTTKYCNSFIRGLPCSNPECVYLHDLGDDDDRFTKEEIQAGHSKLNPTPGRDQTIVTGNGGPSGTGKRPTGDPILPAPVFIQDNGASSGASPSIVRSSSSSSSLNAQAPSVPGGLGPTTSAVVNGSSAQVSSPRPLTAAAIVAGVASLSLSPQLSSSSTTAASSSSALDLSELPPTSPVAAPSSGNTIDKDYGVDKDAGSFLVASISTDSAEGSTADSRLGISKKVAKVAAINASAKASGSEKSSSSINKVKMPGAGGLSLASPVEKEGVAIVEHSLDGPKDSKVQKEKGPKSSSQKGDKTSTAMLESKKTVAGKIKIDESSTQETEGSLKTEAAELFLSNDPRSNSSFGASSTMASSSSYGRSDRGESTSLGSSLLRPPLSAAFNGFGRSAVFPVPLTSFTDTVWSNILRVPFSGSPELLSVDPFGRLLVPISELLDLTLPPVDAVCLGSGWPRPPGYYMLGVGHDGVTHGPPTSLVQRMARQHRQLVWGSELSNPMLGVGSVVRAVDSGNGGVGMTTGTPAVGTGSPDGSSPSHQHQSLQPSVIVEGQVVLQGAPPPLATAAVGITTTATTQQQQTQVPSSAQPIAVLQQIFPGVKMSYGAPVSVSGSTPAVHSQTPTGSSSS